MTANCNMCKRLHKLDGLVVVEVKREQGFRKNLHWLTETQNKAELMNLLAQD